MRVGGRYRVGALTAVLVIAGCGGESGADSGRMTVTYRDATSAEAIRGRALMENAHLLEEVAADVNAALELPADITLVRLPAP